jgi:hypothetical protein
LGLKIGADVLMQAKSFVSCSGKVAFLFVIVLYSVSSAHARTVVVDCHKVRTISHSRVHFGMSVIGSRITNSEKNYLHGQYHHLSQVCASNPKAKAHLRVSPQLSSLMSEYGFFGD